MILNLNQTVVYFLMDIALHAVMIFSVIIHLTDQPSPHVHVNHIYESFSTNTALLSSGLFTYWN